MFTHKSFYLTEFPKKAYSYTKRILVNIIGIEPTYSENYEKI